MLLVLVGAEPTSARVSFAAAAMTARALATDTVHVVAPTGETNTDRASILAAIEEVRPDGTLQFAPGTYLVGEVIRIETPGVTLVGHADGTTLRGCNPDAYEQAERDFASAAASAEAAAVQEAASRCGMLELTGGGVTIRGFTFEYSRMGVILGCCQFERVFRNTEGGYLIEGNTFRRSLNGIRPFTTERTVIRGNRFVDTFHAISGAGSNLHVLDNEISAPEPEEVPAIGHPSFAVALGPLPRQAAESLAIDANGEGNVIAGNRIEGHPDGIFIAIPPGTRFRDNVIRDNTIVVERVPFPPAGVRPYIVDVTDEGDSTIVGIPFSMYPVGGPPGLPEEDTAQGTFEDNLIAGNRLVGAEGTAIAIHRGSRNRIVGNTITGIRRREPFPGNTVLSSSERWREANGSGIWLSPGSDGNEIVANTFEDIAAHAIVLEGDSNRVELRSASDSVHDVGSGNRVTVAERGPAARADVVARIDSLARDALDSGPVAGFSAAVLQGDDTLLLAGYGHADIGLGVNTTEETKYRLIGPSATILAALVMRHVEAGRISLDEEVNPHLPDFPWQGRRVTVRQLLDATSGLPDYHYLGDPYWSGIAVPKSPDQVTALFAGRPFAHEPGERQQWTISGFHMAGLLLERLTGRTYAELIEGEIVAPLGLEHTAYCGDDREVVDGLATGYETGGSRILPARPVSPSTYPFVVSVCASAGDVAEIQRAIRTGRLITPASYADMTALSTPAAEAMQASGRALVAGMVLDTLAGGATFMFGGLELGYASHAIDIPEHDLTVVVLTNAVWAPGPSLAFNLSRAALELPLVNEEPSAAIPDLLDLPISLQQIEQYVGTWRVRLRDAPPPYRLYERTYRIYSDNGALWIQPLGAPPERLLRQGEHSFAWGSSPEERLVFSVESGRAVSIAIRGPLGWFEEGPRVGRGGLQER